MADDVSITFTADVSDLQKGMQQATNTVETTTNALRIGAAQINASFASLSQAYMSEATRRMTTVQTSSNFELALARQTEQARYDIALNEIRTQSSMIKEQAQIGQISRQDELSSLLSLETQREDIERRHLQYLKSTYQDGTVAYATAQRQLEELASQSALRIQAIEQNVTQQIYNDYKHSFEQIGSGVTSSIMGMITGHMKLRDSARTVLLQIIQSFTQAKVKMVADWLAGVTAQTTATQAEQASMTGAVAAGTAARSGLESSASTASIAGTIGAALKSIMASAGETFAGVFGFLSPVMGPAAAGPAAGAEAAVLSTATSLASFASGAWSLPADMIAQVHQGEMIVPAGPASAMRDFLSGSAQVAGSPVHVHHSTNFHVSAIDSDGVRGFFDKHGKAILRTINEGVRTGSHLGLSRLVGA